MARKIFSRGSERLAQAGSVAVIGLGRFGGSLALELEAQGTEVLGIDADENIVQSFNGRLTHVVRADATQEEVLRQLSVHEFDRAVVGIGSDIEASILTTSRLLKFQGPQIWAKAISEPHAEILGQLGVEHVIRPEHDMGKRVAHLVRGGILDYVEFEDDFVMVRTSPPSQAQDRPLGILGLRDKYGITVVAVKRLGGMWGHTTAQTVLYDDDQIIVQGSKTQAEKFSTLT
ncbi:TrkA family potassium uptake protein [Pseudarthrobacter sp. AL07]|uniref:potassium channel family protein n=1 Tax=unclassified Pseudarthrobacter TaxID=2647000 RepID=UPI00249AB802|nr:MULTISPECIES: TrkA family potassium uptake protein [unclassified Pseudarthrobacter]MDI3196197.1 TrkA family potassium uptake protein [Pseudarthrobacter sp. AL20]MDI3210268.1 TrkA family potassium uptake protein [Pseudarthrobacter sp. AL07]